MEYRRFPFLRSFFIFAASLAIATSAAAEKKPASISVYKTGHGIWIIHPSGAIAYCTHLKEPKSESPNEVCEVISKLPDAYKNQANHLVGDDIFFVEPGNGNVFTCTIAITMAGNPKGRCKQLFPFIDVK